MIPLCWRNRCIYVTWWVHVKFNVNWLMLFSVAFSATLVALFPVVSISQTHKTSSISFQDCFLSVFVSDPFVQGRKMHLCTVNKCRHLQWWFVSTRKIPIVEFFGPGGGCLGSVVVAMALTFSLISRTSISFWIMFRIDLIFQTSCVVFWATCTLMSGGGSLAMMIDISKLPYWSAFTLSGSRPRI